MGLFVQSHSAWGIRLACVVCKGETSSHTLKQKVVCARGSHNSERYNKRCKKAWCTQTLAHICTLTAFTHIQLCILLSFEFSHFLSKINVILPWRRRKLLLQQEVIYVTFVVVTPTCLVLARWYWWWCVQSYWSCCWERDPESSSGSDPVELHKMTQGSRAATDPNWQRGEREY